MAALLTTSQGNQLLTETAIMEVLLSLADRESMRNDPALIRFGDAAGSGSLVSQVSIVGLDGATLMAAVAEGAATAGATSLPDVAASITIARQALRYDMSDLLRSVDAQGIFNPVRFARSMVGSADMRLQAMIANVADDFTTTVGSTGVPFSVGDWYDAQFALVLQSVPPPYLAELHPHQYNNFQGDLRTETGPNQYVVATQDQLALRGPGYKGQFNMVPIFVSSKVPDANAGADHAGAMFGRGAIGYREASIPPAPGVDAVFAGPIMTAFDYNPDTGLLMAVGSYQVGVSKLEDLRGVTIISDHV